jgi:hypothetical protein
MKNFFLLTMLVCLNIILHAQVTNGLIAYYPFNGNANDVSGNNNNGTVNGATLTTDRFGKANKAYLFDGNSAYIYVPNSPSLQSPGSTNTITQAAWVYLNGMSNIGSPDGPITMKSDTRDNGFMYRMTIGGSNTLVASYIDWYHPAAASYTFNLHTWYFLVTTYDGSVGKCYINGTLIGSTTLDLTIPTDNLPLIMGMDSPGAYEYFNGVIDDLRIYNRALTEAEIDTLVNDFPTAGISDKKITEGNSGTSVMKFKVTLNHASDKYVKMKYKTVDGTAKSGSDYVAIQGTLTFQPLQTTKYISVTINGDITNESNEKFKVVLSNPTHVLLEDKTGMGTIKNDDATFTQAQAQSAEKLSTGLRITLFPNPANNYISFSGVNEKNVFVEILDINGKAVLKQRLTNNNIDVSKLASGNYIVKLTMKEHTELLKLVKL